VCPSVAAYGLIARIWIGSSNTGRKQPNFDASFTVEAVGEIRKRGRIWWIRYYRAGRRFEESSGSEKRGAAVNLLRLREGDLAKGLPVSPKIGRLRFEQAATDLVNEYIANGRRTVQDLRFASGT
jgi:hypothetical protein